MNHKPSQNTISYNWNILKNFYLSGTRQVESHPQEKSLFGRAIQEMLK